VSTYFEYFGKVDEAWRPRRSDILEFLPVPPEKPAPADDSYVVVEQRFASRGEAFRALLRALR